MRSNNGVFGVKLLHEDFEKFKGFAAFRRLINTSEIYYLYRNDKIRQALSYFFAEQTGMWIAQDTPIRPPSEVAYDFRRIRAIQTMLIAQDLDWRLFLSTLGKPVKMIEYEQFAASAAQMIRGIARDMDTDIDGSAIGTKMVRQSGDLNKAFEARYRDDLRAMYSIDGPSLVNYNGLDVRA